VYDFINDVISFVQTGKIRYFLIFFLVIWIRWFAVNYLALRYKPYTEKYRCRKSVIIPVVDEDPEVFTNVLRSVKKQRPQEIIVIINGPKNRDLEQVCKSIKGVVYHWTRTPGKRNAIRHGMKYATGDIIILVDSDTIWAPGMVKELIRPFHDKDVGGVTTRQRISNPTVNVMTRFCDWLEDIRAYGSLQAMSVLGQVGCLPGRTIAFRSDILKQVMTEFMNETFLGFHKEVSDDRSLTNLVLKAGYKTVLQNTALVYTEAPKTWRKFIRQQLRWSEGSQYNNVRMSSWMIENAKFMFCIYWSDTLLPFMLWGLYGSYLINYIFFKNNPNQYLLLNPHSVVLIAIFTFGGAYFSYAVRQLAVINEHKSHLIFIPIYLLLLSFLMAPIRIVGFARLADDLGWGTRGSGYQGAKYSLRIKNANA
jgi:hyaluronan synthase